MQDAHGKLNPGLPR